MKLFGYQQKIVDRYWDKKIIPLFLDPGLGKSATALSIACKKYEAGLIDSVFIIAPNHVDKQWVVEQVPLWTTVPYVVYFNKKSKKPIPHVEDVLNIVVVNIDVFSTTVAYQRYVDFVRNAKTMIILDEATRIKNPKALRTQRLLYEFNDVIRRGKTIISSTPVTESRCILTGTPITNGAFDVWAMFEFLQPSYFNMNEFAFKNKYGMFHTMQINGRAIRILINKETWIAIHNCETFEQANFVFGIGLDSFTYIKKQEEYEGPYKHVEELRQRLVVDSTFIRVEDVHDMPERIYNRKLLEMSDEQARAYYSMENQFIAIYKDKEVSATTKLVSYLRLQQIASGFIVTDTITDEDILKDTVSTKEVTWFDKCPKIEQLLIDAESVSGPTIIVCHFSAEAERIYNELCEKGYTVCLRTGWKNVGTDEEWKENKYQFMVANIRVISMGFNYQNSHNMIFYSNTFSLEDRIQVEARIFRTGQTCSCIYTDYVMIDTIDMKVYAVLKQKKSLSDYVRDNSVDAMLTSRDEVFEQEYSDCAF